MSVYPNSSWYLNLLYNSLGCPFDMTKDRWIQHGYELPVTGLPIEGPYSPDNNKNITAFWWRMGIL
jgi:hypothetical protein